MSDVITKNLVLLSQNITNLKSVLDQLQKTHIISKNESEYVLSGKSSLDRNSELLALIGRKDWEKVEAVFTEILKNTGNGNSALLIENGGLPTKETTGPLLGSKWWPMKKYLPESFLHRKIGENLLIKDIRKSLQNDENHAVVLTGLPAIGKTATAISYARRYASKYDQIIWVSCLSENYLSVTYSFYFLLCELDKSSFHSRDPPEWVRKAFSFLADCKCLLIYDNARCLKGKNGIEDILPKKNPNFHSLITSRDVNWNFKTIKLDFLSPGESVEFMKYSLTPELIYEDKELAELCNLLDNWPLALQIAKETLNGSDVNLKLYTERVKYSDEILRLQFGEYPLAFCDVICILLDAISEERGPESDIFNLLLILGYLEPENVGYQLLGDITKISIRQLDNDLKFLEKMSLLSRNVTAVDGEKVKTVSIPRLVQKAIRNFNEDPETILTKIFSASTSQYYKTMDLYMVALRSTEYIWRDFVQVIFHDFIAMVTNQEYDKALQLAKLLSTKFLHYKAEIFKILAAKVEDIPESGDSLGNLARILTEILPVVDFLKKSEYLLNKSSLMKEMVNRLSSNKMDKWQQRLVEKNSKKVAGFQKFYVLKELKKDLSSIRFSDIRDIEYIGTELQEFNLMEELTNKIPYQARSEWETKITETEEKYAGLHELLSWINQKTTIQQKNVKSS